MRLLRLQFYALLALTTYFGLSRGGIDLAAAVSDKLLHCAGYIVLLIAGSMAYPRRSIAVFTGLFAYSIGIETIQYFLPYRSFEVPDILANLAGLVIGSLLWRLYRRRRSRGVTADEPG